MELNRSLLAAVLIVTLAVLLVFWKTKTTGFGKFNTGILTFVFVMSLSAVLVVGGKIDYFLQRSLPSSG